MLPEIHHVVMVTKFIWIGTILFNTKFMVFNDNELFELHQIVICSTSLFSHNFSNMKRLNNDKSKRQEQQGA